MITTANFKELIQTIRPEELQQEIDGMEDYILMEVHIFNVGGYATVKSMHYNTETDENASSTGNLFLDKDDFLMLLEETQALEY